jgi:predicted MFS family arabinose efflux permease
MHIARLRALGQNYAFVVVAVIFLCLLVSAGTRGAPGVLLTPLEQAFGWSKATVSLSAAIGIFLYGLVGPFAAALMDKVGMRRTLVGALALMSVATGSSYFMTEPWHLVATWGVFSGLGSGCIAVVLAATVSNRWFATNRGLAMGVLTASTATGTLIFVPALAALSEAFGWQAVVLAVAVGPLVLIPLVLLLVPERPASMGLRRYGATEDEPAPVSDGEGPLQLAIGSLVFASKTKVFWLLFATFFVCGFTTNGLVGTHLISLCIDQGIPEVRAAGLLALMGIFDLIGTTLSGWLTDRYNPRVLLFFYYGLRGLSLMYLPFSDFSFYSLTFFAVFYGLDWIATVPPTLRLTNEAFGNRIGPVVFGWIVAGHQLGGASAAFFGGYMRSVQGDYFAAFFIAGMTGLVAAVISLMIGRKRSEAQTLQPA